MKKNQKMSTCNRLDLETLESRPVMLKILPEHCIWRLQSWTLVMAIEEKPLASLEFSFQGGGRRGNEDSVLN
jgi:hypothetical protein